MLAALEPQWVRYETRIHEGSRVPHGWDLSTAEGMAAWQAAGRPFETAVWGHEYVHEVHGIDEAQGLWLLCPACYVKNGGPVNTHSIQVTLAGRGATDVQGSHGKDGRPSRWEVKAGTGFRDLTLAPSIDCGCWHGHITNGECTP